jgi:hypothetical protein
VVAEVVLERKYGSVKRLSGKLYESRVVAARSLWMYGEEWEWEVYRSWSYVWWWPP